MTTVTTPIPQDQTGQDVPEDSYLVYGDRGKPFLRIVWNWATTVDHKRIGLMYGVAVLFFFMIGGLFAMALRTELLGPGPLFGYGATLAVKEAAAWNFYNQLFTIHGAMMVFLFIIPAIPAILGNFALPMMLGAKDVAFPRLNLLSWYIYMLGACFLTWILFGGFIHLLFPQLAQVPFWNTFIPAGLDTGWTFYTPYSTTTSTGTLWATMGAFILGFSSILTGVNFVATVHMLRPRGMTWFRIPLFVWSLYATALIQILATPVLAITLLLLAMETAFKIGIFDPALGGDPVLYQHFFWFYSHPAVYIMILPALGVISEVIGVMSRKHVFGYNFIAISSIAIALLGFLVWGHHMFTSGQSPLTNAIFSLITFSVAVPSAVKVFNWLTTMYGGSIRMTTPMVSVLCSIVLFTIGGLTGMFLGTLNVDIFFHDTYFIVAHFHYVMMGTALFSLIGGIYYWWPKMFGSMYNQTWANIFVLTAFVGFHLAFFVQFVAGAQGMPRRYATYPEFYQVYHVISTLGAYLMGAGLFGVLGHWMWHWIWPGMPAPANPWGSNTLEWQTPSPPPHDNFKITPIAGDPYDLHRWTYISPQEGWKLDESEDPTRPVPDAVRQH